MKSPNPHGKHRAQTLLLIGVFALAAGCNAPNEARVEDAVNIVPVDTTPTDTAFSEIDTLLDVVPDGALDTDDAPEVVIPLHPIERCNGHAELCDRTFDAVTFAATHNAMSNREERWVAPNQTYPIRRQLEDGVRFLLLDTHLLDGEAFLCHAFCTLGKAPLEDVLAEIRDFLDANPHEVMGIFFEDYIEASMTEEAFAASGLSAHVYTHPGDALNWPTLREMIEDQRRLLVLSQNEQPPPAWYHRGWDLVYDTPYSVENIGDFGCDINRGSASSDLLMVNHWLGPSPITTLAAEANAFQVLLEHAQMCEASLGHQVNILPVDFYEIGALMEVVDVLNGF